MDYTKVITRVEQHLQKHPSDYQSVISLFKLRSKAIDQRIEQRKVAKLKRIAECRRRLNEEHS